jgi:uncharacterized membrane protein
MSAMHYAVLKRAVLVLAVAGMFISGYLLVTRWTERPVVCAGLGSCAAVQSSAYARLAGVPVALLGLGMYGALAALALRADRPWAALALFGLALAGALYSAYLTWVELALLQSVCLWCVASAVTVTAIAALATAMVLSPPATAAGMMNAE